MERAGTGKSTVRAGRFALVCLAAGALLALCAAPASAAIKTVSKSLKLNPGGTGSVAAKCAAGDVPLSAGFTVTGFNFNHGGIAPVATQRLPGGSSATGKNVGSVAGTLTDYAYCDTDARTILTRSVHVPVPVKKTRAAAVLCPAGSVPLSGGYQFTNGAHGSAAAFRSRMIPGGWQVAGYNGGPGPSSVTVFVYCQTNVPQLATGSSTVNVPKFQRGSARAGCPPGSRIVSGGFDGHLTTKPEIRVALPIGSFKDRNGWRVNAAAGTDQPSAKLTVYSYCEQL
jgi:hypothetical protein